jgi:hypothetical protein
VQEEYVNEILQCVFIDYSKCGSLQQGYLYQLCYHIYLSNASPISHRRHQEKLDRETHEGDGNRVDIKKLLKSPRGYELIPGSGKRYRVHIDGYDFLDFLRCTSSPLKRKKACPKAPREEFIYTHNDGVLVGMRYNNWKIVFHEQRAEGFDVWQDPFISLRAPKIFNLRSDPFEKADHESDYYTDWCFRRIFALAPAQVGVYKFLNSFREFPPRQIPPSFSVDVDIRDIVDKCGTADEPLSDNSACFPLPKDSPDPRLPGYGG